MNKTNCLEGFLDKAALFVTRLGMYLFGFMVSIHAIEIFSRYIFNHSFMFVHELSVLIFVWIIFIELPVVYQQRKLISVTDIYKRLPKRIKRVADIIRPLLIVAFLCILIVQTWKLQPLQAMHRGYLLPVPSNLYSLPILVAGIMMLGISIIRAAIALSKPRETHPDSLTMKESSSK